MSGKVKVIKREDRIRKVEKPVKAEPKKAARDMVATVSTWVNEFQQRRRQETKQAFKQLFNDPSRPSEV